MVKIENNFWITLVYSLGILTTYYNVYNGKTKRKLFYYRVKITPLNWPLIKGKN